jgi:hypothetical protein
LSLAQRPAQLAGHVRCGGSQSQQELGVPQSSSSPWYRNGVPGRG